MRVVIVGARGQLGQALAHAYRSQPALEVICWQRPQHDITAPSISDAVVRSKPDIVINCAAWTDVDAAQSNPDAAYAVNALGPHYLAEGCRRCGALLVHVSTNEVFAEVFAGDGERFYREYDSPRPGSVYSASKLAGEQAVLQRYPESLIVRTAWLFGPGGANFPSKIIAAADKHGKLRVVADEFGNPSYAPDVAVAIIRLIELGRCGIYHVVNQGHASRFEFAQRVLQATNRSHVPLTPISHTEWPRPAPAPLHAVLVNQAAAALGVVLRPWQQAVDEYATQIVRRINVTHEENVVSRVN